MRGYRCPALALISLFVIFGRAASQVLDSPLLFSPKTIPSDEWGIFGSRSCAVDANCVDGIGEVRDSVVQITQLANGNSCSGTLLAGPSDGPDGLGTGTLLVLTARHCVTFLNQESAYPYATSTWGLLIDYDLPCNATEVDADGFIFSRYVQGLEIVFLDKHSDTAVLKLVNDIPRSWNVTTAGWTTAPLEPSFDWLAISHPAGDSSKVSFGVVSSFVSYQDQYSDGSISDGDPLYCANDTTLCNFFGGRTTLGALEGGASGSGIVAELGGSGPPGATDGPKRRVVGTLSSGAGDDCNHDPDSDEGSLSNFGRLSAAWAHGLAYYVYGPDAYAPDIDVPYQVHYPALPTISIANTAPIVHLSLAEPVGVNISLNEPPQVASPTFVDGLDTLEGTVGTGRDEGYNSSAGPSSTTATVEVTAQAFTQQGVMQVEVRPKSLTFDKTNHSIPQTFWIVSPTEKEWEAQALSSTDVIDLEVYLTWPAVTDEGQAFNRTKRLSGLIWGPSIVGDGFENPIEVQTLPYIITKDLELTSAYNSPSASYYSEVGLSFTANYYRLRPETSVGLVASLVASSGDPLLVALFDENWKPVSLLPQGLYYDGGSYAPAPAAAPSADDASGPSYAASPAGDGGSASSAGGAVGGWSTTYLALLEANKTYYLSVYPEYYFLGSDSQPPIVRAYHLEMQDLGPAWVTEALLSSGAAYPVYLPFSDTVTLPPEAVSTSLIVSYPEPGLYNVVACATNFTGIAIDIALTDASTLTNLGSASTRGLRECATISKKPLSTGGTYYVTLATGLGASRKFEKKPWDLAVEIYRVDKDGNRIEPESVAEGEGTLAPLLASPPENAGN